MVEALKFHQEMKYLDISCNEIGDGLVYFTELFEINHTLQNLHVRKNELNLKESDVKKFMKSLYNNSNLYFLDLKDNKLDDKFA